MVRFLKVGLQVGQWHHKNPINDISTVLKMLLQPIQNHLKKLQVLSRLLTEKIIVMPLIMYIGIDAQGED